MSAPQTQNINDTFFTGMYREVWRKLIPPGLSEAEVDFIVEIGKLTKESAVLDLMCGYGRHALELGRRGYPVTAVDNAKEYVAEIRLSAENNGLPVEAVHSSILNMELHKHYDAAICMGNSFAFFNEEEALSVLNNVSAHLKAGGIFLINTWTIAEIAIKYYREKDWSQVEDYKYVVDNRYFLNPARIETDHIIINADGETEVLKGVDYIFTLSELERMFKKAGLKTQAVYSTPRKRTFRFGDTRAYIVAVKE